MQGIVTQWTAGQSLSSSSPQESPTQPLNETLKLLSLVASRTDNAVIIMDARGLTTWVNDAFSRMSGYALPDAIGTRPDHLLAGPETSRQTLQEIDDGFRFGHGVRKELLQYRLEGTTRWISLSLTPVHDTDGIVKRWIGLGSDITKQCEVQKGWETARKAVEKSGRLKSDFLANLSHEIRTPMNAIIGMTELTLCTELDSDQTEYVTSIKRSAESLMELLADVLDHSRIEAGQAASNQRALTQCIPLAENSAKNPSRARSSSDVYAEWTRRSWKGN